MAGEELAEGAGGGEELATELVTTEATVATAAQELAGAKELAAAMSGPSAIELAGVITRAAAKELVAAADWRRRKLMARS